MICGSELVRSDFVFDMVFDTKIGREKVELKWLLPRVCQSQLHQLRLLQRHRYLKTSLMSRMQFMCYVFSSIVLNQGTPSDPNHVNYMSLSNG